MLAHTVGHEEPGVLRPVVISFGSPNFLFTQGFPMGCAGVLFGWAAVGDMAVHNKERGTVVGVLECGKSTRQHRQVVGVADSQDVPTITEETRSDVFREGQGG